MLPFQWKMILPHSPLAGCTFFRIHSLKGESNFQITVGFLQLPWLVPVILARSITGRKRQGRLLWVQYYSTDSCPHRWSREKRHHSYSHRKWGISQRLMMKGLMGNGPIHPGPEVLISSCGCDSTLLWGMMRLSPLLPYATCKGLSSPFIEPSSAVWLPLYHQLQYCVPLRWDLWAQPPALTLSP